MSGDGCACKEPVTAAVAMQSGSGAGPGPMPYEVVVWDPLSLGAGAVQVSRPIEMRGGNALEFVGVVIGAGGAVQALLQPQVSNDGINWLDAGSATQLLSLGYTASSLISGLSSSYFRITAINQTGNTLVFLVVARTLHN